ncbi:MAG: MFS transporter [Chitinophagaceae bacterium]
MRFTQPIHHRSAISIFFFCCGCIFATWAARIPVIKDRFHFNEAELGAILFMLPLGSMIALPFAGWSVSHFGSRTITFVAAVFYLFLLVAIGYSSTVLALSIVLFFFGFWGDVLNIAMNTQAILVQEEMYSKPLMSSFHGMWSIGAMVGAFLGGLTMKSLLSTAHHFLWVAAIILILVSFFSFHLIRKESTKSKEQKIFAWPDKALWLLGAICFCCALAEGAMADWSSLYYKQVISDVNKVSTTGYTAFALMMAFGRFIGDWLTAKLGYRLILMMNSIFIVAGLGFAIGIPEPIFVITGFGLVGLGVSTIIPIVYSVAGKTKTMATSVALAAVSTVGFTGFLIGPPLIGFVAHEIGLRWALGIILLLGLVIFALGKKVKT